MTSNLVFAAHWWHAMQGNGGENCHSTANMGTPPYQAVMSERETYGF